MYPTDDAEREVDLGGALASAATMDEAASEAEAGLEDGGRRGRGRLRWYVVQTYSGYENKVKTNLDQRVKSMDMEDRIFQVVVPTEDEIEIRDGQRRTVSKKLFPGYVFVRCAWTTTPGTSFATRPA